MKRICLMSAVAAAALNAFGIGATQEWVRRHVVAALSGVARTSSATNIAVTGALPATAFANGDTNSTYSCTITAGTGTHAALKVVESSIESIPAGTFYALDNNGDYVNCSNAVIQTIYAMPYVTTNVTINAFAATTNAVTMGSFWAVDSTNGVWRMGIDGDTILYNTGRRADYIVLRSTRLPERAAAVIIPPAVARMSIRDIFALIAPPARARVNSEVVYTVNAETTIAISTITFTRKNRFGKESTITFTPEGLHGVYKGPSGPFESKSAAEAAASDMSNWDFGDWTSIWNVEGFGEMSQADLRNSDAWKQLVAAVATEKTEKLVETPNMPAHPCPAPDDFWVFNATIWNDTENYTDEQARELAWQVNEKYSDGEGGYSTEALERWRGQHKCKCGVVGCSKYGESQHREGRVRIVNGVETFTDDVDGGDGCKCCIRCVQYGAQADIYETIDEYNDHRASGEGSGFCGCACGRYTTENEADWDKDYHNWPAHALSYPQLDYSCMCYCSREKAENGEFVRHAKYAGDSPWCEKICARCGMVEDKTQYIKHNWPAFDTRHVTLRAPTWEDHTPRAEAGEGVSALNDPTYYDRCGCACGAYDTANGGMLPKDYAKFHQFHNSTHSCRCTCGQLHRKNQLTAPDENGEGGTSADEWPCAAICAVCKQVEDTESTATISIDGAVFARLVMRDPTAVSDHTAHATECGCNCYNGTWGGTSSRRSWSIGINSEPNYDYDGENLPFHKRADGGCACRCGQICHTATGESFLLWRLMHFKWYEEGECNGLCSVCGRKQLLGDEAKITDHTPSAEHCGCKCGFYTAANSSDMYFHNLCRNPAIPCWCACGRMHPGYSQRHECQICCNCGMAADGSTPDNELLHKLKTGATDGNGNRICRCDCGYFSSLETIVPDISNTTFIAASKLPSADGPLHDFDSTDIARGVANCRCVCGKKHEFRVAPTAWKNQNPYAWCDGICQFCRERKANGDIATEDDHTPKPSSEHLCGCRCGYYGIDPENGYGLHEAKSSRLHIQSHSNGTGTNPAWCQCWGNGTGGAWHWHNPFASTSCSKICQNTRPTDSSLGHLAAGENGPHRIFIAATPADHEPTTYGCGCKCGMCTADNVSLWGERLALHHPAQNATDQCHCSCSLHKLVGTGYKGHTFIGTSCTCTCGEVHRSTLNECGYCLGGNGSVSCGYVHRGTTRLENVLANHDTGDATRCTCRCGMFEISHSLGEWTSTSNTTSYVCEECGNTITRREWERVCTRTNCDRHGTDWRVTEWRESGHGVHEEEAITSSGCVHCGRTDGLHDENCPYYNENTAGGGSATGGETSGTGGVEDI